MSVPPTCQGEDGSWREKTRATSCYKVSRALSVAAGGGETRCNEQGMNGSDWADDERAKIEAHPLRASAAEESAVAEFSGAARDEEKPACHLQEERNEEWQQVSVAFECGADAGEKVAACLRASSVGDYAVAHDQVAERKNVHRAPPLRTQFFAMLAFNGFGQATCLKQSSQGAAGAHPRCTAVCDGATNDRRNSAIHEDRRSVLCGEAQDIV